MPRSELLCLISVLDTLVTNSTLQADWISYKKLIKKSRAQPDKSSAAFEAERQLESCLVRLEERVVKGRMLRYVSLQRRPGSKLVIDELANFIRLKMAEMEAQAGGDTFPATWCLVVLLTSLSRQEDRKLVGRMFDIYRKLGTGLIVQEPGAVWNMATFWESTGDTFGESVRALFVKYSAGVNSEASSWFAAQIAGLTSLVASSRTAVQNIRLQLRPQLHKPDLTLAELSGQIEQLLGLLDVTGRCSAQLKLILATFAEAKQPMTSSSILGLGQIICQLASVSDWLSREQTVLISLVERGIQHTQFLLSNLLHAARDGNL